MFRTILTLIAGAVLAAPAFAESHAAGETMGNAEAGATAFKQCLSCHVIADETGTVLHGKAAKTGPNLFGVVGRVAGTAEGFRYSSSLAEAGEKGLVWDEENIVAWLMDPKGFLALTLDDSKARTKMSFKVRKEEDARDLAALLALYATPAAEGEGAATAEETPAEAPASN